MSEDVKIELCSDSGCGLIVTNHDDEQERISLMPDEVLEARSLSGEKLTEFLVDIDPKFAKGIEAIGIEKISRDLNEKKLPPVLKKQLKEEE